MEKFTIEKNDFLKQDIQGYFHTIYHSMYYNNTDTLHINKLKNDTLSFSIEELRDAGAKLLQNLNDDIPIILNEHNQNFTICIIPRAKIESIYQKTQLLFKEVINTFVRNFNQSQKIFSLENGTNYIIRIKNTKTTHLRNIIGSYENTGDKPYVGISKDTCSFSPFIKGKNILLIDDLYTKSININEDMIQALLDNGAKSVIFYSIGKH
ncbi:hypothetical protein [Capnocytophaga gingivalis]|uniref:hypothetical protein n=1 Tax=Capnocytophaga gingivalis TaxID=1017 RepID=UPI0028D531DE|nr:hypothetical protein [Capnocytophaga gingivalis]